jgi:hypothetical protein
MVSAREQRPMTRNDVSRYSWIALAGLATVIVSVVAGIVVASEPVMDNDEALLAGLIWGGWAGLGLGGAVVGAIHGLAGEELSNRVVLWATSPGLIVGLPLFLSGLLNREVIVPALQMFVLVAFSAATADLARRFVDSRRRRRIAANRDAQ